MSAIWRRLVKLAVLVSSLLIPVAALAQTDAIQGHCTLGGTKALVSGLSSTNYNQGIIPGCTVSVYLTGTTTLATIYSNSTGTPLANPFTAVLAGSPNPGYWIFYAATGQGYDVKLSGGGGNPLCTTAPNCYVTPLTYTDLKVGGTGGGGGGLTFFSAGNLNPLFNTNVANPGTTPNLSFTQQNAPANTIFGNFTGTSGPPFFATFTCTGLLSCTYDGTTNVWNVNIPSTSALSVTATSPIRVNGGPGPVSSGTANIDCPTCGAPQLQMNVLGSDSTHVFVPFTTCTPSSAGVVAYNVCDFKSGAAAIFRGGIFGYGASANMAFSGATLPSWLPAANVTDVQLVAYSDGYGASSGSCGGTGITCGSFVYPPNNTQVKVPITGATGSNIGTIVANALLQSGPYCTACPSPFTYVGALTVNQVGLLVGFSGVTKPSTTVLNIGWPLSYNSDLNLLSVSPYYPYSLAPILTSNLPTSSNPNPTFTPPGLVWMTSDNTQTTLGATCTGSGTAGTGYALCQSTSPGVYTLLTNFGSGGGGGGVTSVATGTGLTGGPITSTGTISCVDSTSSTKGCVQVDGTTITAAGGVISAVGGGGGGLSGQTTNYVPKATSATASTTSSIIEDQGTGIVIHGTGTSHGITLPEGTSIAASSGNDILYADSTDHCIKYSANGGSYSCLGPVSVGFAISSGVIATPAAPLILAPANGTVSHCYFTTNNSDGATALTFNIKFNGTNIISGTNATVAAGTVAGTVSTFNLTSGTIAITAAQKWEIDITSGTSSWSGIAQCF